MSVTETVRRKIGLTGRETRHVRPLQLQTRAACLLAFAAPLTAAIKARSPAGHSSRRKGYTPGSPSVMIDRMAIVAPSE